MPTTTRFIAYELIWMFKLLEIQNCFDLTPIINFDIIKFDRIGF